MKKQNKEDYVINITYLVDKILLLCDGYSYIHKHIHLK